MSIDDAGGLLDAARNASDTAQEQLAQAQAGDVSETAVDELIKQAKRQQERVNESLIDLIKRLDQGHDALALQLQLQQLQQMQEDLASESRTLLPKTIGRSVDQLDETVRSELAALSRRQAAMAQRADALARQMRNTAEALGRPDADEQDQAAAETLSQAASIAQRRGLSETMDKAAADVEQNRLASAGEAQGRSKDIMQQMLGEFGRQQKRSSQILQRRLLELAEAIGKLIEHQKGQITLLQDAVALLPLDASLSILRGNTLAVEDQSRASRRTQAVADELALAAESQAGAIKAVRSENRPAAADTEAEALRRLEAALSLVRQMRNQAQQETAQRTRRELREAYERLARQQDELRVQTEPLAALQSLDRRQRAGVVTLGDRQAVLRNDVAATVEQEQLPMLFQHVHRRIDTAADEAAQMLHDGQATPELVGKQVSVAHLLRQLAFALEEAKSDQPFDTPAQKGKQQGGGGGKGAPQLVPPATQLKLMRGLQDGIYQQTKEIEAAGNVDAAVRQRRLQRLAVDQSELATLGETLIREMSRYLRLRDRRKLP